MGALSRLKVYLLGWMKAKWQTYPAFVEDFANELMSVAPGLTIGTTFDSGGGIFLPTVLGEVDGEIYLSNDLVPAGAWIWQNSTWNILAGTAGASPVTHIYPRYDEDSFDDKGLYREITGSPFPTLVTWWTSPAKITKVQELFITYDANNFVIQEQWKYYYLGVLSKTVTDIITNSGPFEVSRSRTIV